MRFEAARAEGFRDGFVDVATISEPIKTGEHTYARYLEVRAKLEDAVYGAPFRVKDDYLDAYADGADAFVIYLATHGNREWVDEIRLNGYE